MRLARIFAVVAAALAAGAAAVGALAGDVRGTDPAGDAKAAGLTRAERAALDIRSVRVVGEEGLGAFVTVTFAGDIEHALGRGHLKDAVAGIVLRPRAAPAQPAGLLARGAELLPLTVRLSRTRVAHVQKSTAETYRKTRSTAVGVVRNGRQLVFFIVGGGFSNVAAIDVRTFANLPEQRGAKPGLAPFIEGDPTDEELIEIDPSELSDMELQALKGDLQGKVRTLEKHALTVETARENLDRQLHAIGPTHPAAGALRAARESLDQANDAVLDLIRFLNGGITAIDNELRSRISRMPMLDVNGSCSLFDPSEVMCSGSALTVVKRRALADATSPLTALRMLVPGGRQITAFLCPGQLPSGSLSQTTTPNDTLTCTGGMLVIGQSFTFNLRTSPGPSPGMGVQVFAQQDGAFKGPFAFAGP